MMESMMMMAAAIFLLLVLADFSLADTPQAPNQRKDVCTVLIRLANRMRRISQKGDARKVR